MQIKKNDTILVVGKLKGGIVVMEGVCASNLDLEEWINRGSNWSEGEGGVLGVHSDFLDIEEVAGADFFCNEDDKNFNSTSWWGAEIGDGVETGEGAAIEGGGSGASCLSAIKEKKNAREERFMHAACEALFRCGAKVNWLIAKFLNAHRGVGAPLLSKKKVSYWRSGKGGRAPIWCTAHDKQLLLTSQYAKFLGEQQNWKRGTNPSHMSWVTMEMCNIGEGDREQHPMREVCEVLFRYNASSDACIANFLNTYEEGPPLDRSTVGGWRSRREDKAPLRYGTYESQRACVAEYAKFLDKLLVNSKQPMLRASIRKEICGVRREEREHPMREVCEVLFRYNASSDSCIANFLNTYEVEGSPLNRLTVWGWRRRSRGEDKALLRYGTYESQRACVAEYAKFLDKSLVDSTHPGQRASIKKEIRGIGGGDREHPMREACEVLFRYKAASDSYITNFLNTYGGGGPPLDRLTVWGWRRRSRGEDKALLRYGTYESQRACVAEYAKFLDKSLVDSTHPGQRASIKKEIRRIMGYIYSPKETGGRAVAGRKRKYGPAFSKEE